MKVKFSHLMLGGLAIRLLLIAYGTWHDAHMDLKYTDIDYTVLTEGAKYVAEGQSPFYRSTYRYSPLYAYLVLPNLYVHEAFGKLVFCAFDLLCGFLIYKILKDDLLELHLDMKKVLIYTSTWIFNPIVINISTRGSSESIVVLCVLLTLYFFLQRKLVLSGIFYGLAVHVKIYPVLFTLPFVLRLDNEWVERGLNKKNATNAKKPKEQKRRGLFGWIGWFFHIMKYRILFGCVALSVFIAISGLFFYMYGFQCLFEQFLYHATRTDVRHNFSLFWYYLYLRDSMDTVSPIASVGFFLPQLILWLFLSIALYKELPLCLFANTLCFVMLNKVCTVQYFVWWFSLLPLALPFAPSVTMFSFGAIILAWLLIQVLWIRLSYQIEFLGRADFFPMFLSCILFFISNLVILCLFLYKPKSLQKKVEKKE
eukprot:MONOS_2800.1-p1 / transcript=MONOS_2800.1 / gene=MONOS_2800 / organism=Monocercomonoides_exilis_PA203 / gene_product=glycosyltransferase / transcript_product=glycosyltransferase / location=Mono_scaffold00060:56705-58508(-) / protein_length=424 / sequence_SO=supercontig / SO=protein_coding / is_pseudo=false